MPLDETTKKLLADSGFTTDANGKYNYTGGSSSSSGSSKKGDMSNQEIAQTLADYNKPSLLPPAAVSVPTVDDNRNYLNNLINTGNTGQVDWAKMQLANLSGADGKQALSSLFPSNTNAPSVIPSTSVADLLKQLIAKQSTQAVPEYKPYEQRRFQYKEPNYSITADSDKTSFIPTSRAKDRWQQQEELNADSAYKQYGSQFNAYQQLNKQQQDNLLNALALEELNQKTIAQQAQAAIDAANAKTNTENTAYTNAYNRWNALGYVGSETDAAILGVPVGTPTNDATYRNATLAKGSGGGSLGSLGIKDLMQFAQDDEAAVLKKATSDPRLADGINKFADGINYFTLPQLIDAYSRY